MRPSIAGLNVLLLDNYDSYSYNIFQYIAQLIGRPPLVLRNDEASDLSAFLAHQTPRVDAIVVSPGPGKPDRTEDFGLCAQAYHCGLPVLGVCLGMQGLAVAFGGLVVRAPLPMHGRLSPVEHAEEASSGSLLEGIPSPFAVVRYHSLVVHEPSLPGCLRVTARTADADRLIMAMEHQSLPLMGVQFHPESICTEHGLHLFRNFLRRVAETSTSLGPPSKAALPQPARLPPPTKLPPRAPPAALGGTRRVASRRHLLVCEPTLSRPLTAEEIFVTLFGASACSFWLDAADGSRNRFSYMGCGGGPHSFLLSQVAPTSSSDDGVRRVDLSAPRSRLQPDTEEPMAAVGAGEDGPLLGHMRAELRRWSDVTPTRCVLQPSAQPVAPAPAGRQQEARGQPCATATASSSAAAPASTPTATPVSADALPLLPDECAFRGGFVGFLGYEAWHSIGPASGASELRQRNPAVASGSHKPGGGGGGGGSGGGGSSGSGGGGSSGGGGRGFGGEAEAAFLFSDRLLAFDHREGRLYLLCLCDAPPSEAAAAAPAQGHAGQDSSAPHAPHVYSSSWASGLRWIDRYARALSNLSTRAPAFAGAPNAVPASAPTGSSASASARPGGAARFVGDRSRQQYLADIGTVGDHLRAGESYEVCLTTTFRCTSHSPPPLELYRHLRRTNPAPHSAYLRLDPHRLVAAHASPPPVAATVSAAATADDGKGREVETRRGAHTLGAERESTWPRRLPIDALGPGGLAICCSSPERFLRVDGGRRAEAKPIKGTAMRQALPSDDREAARRLQSGEKERSENLMIVDLIRNDLGRVCASGTVNVPSLMHIESYATVHQLVSTICGTLAPEHDALSAAAAAFPPGSMTGAPKARTMRIIDELEMSVPRGAYSGCLGFFSVGGACDLNVIIRTAVIDERGLSIAAGGAIVALSDPRDEYEEVLLKLRPVMRAVAVRTSSTRR